MVVVMATSAGVAAIATSSCLAGGSDPFLRFSLFSSSLPPASKCWQTERFSASSAFSTYPLNKPLQKALAPNFCLPASFATITPLADLYDFICSGPLLSKVGLDPPSVKASLDEWLELGLRLSRNLGFSELFLTPEEKIRVYHYYIPVFLWCKQQLAHHQAQFKEGEEVPALVVSSNLLFMIHWSIV